MVSKQPSGAPTADECEIGRFSRRLKTPLEVGLQGSKWQAGYHIRRATKSADFARDFHDFGMNDSKSLCEFEKVVHAFHIDQGSKTGSCGSDDLVRRTDSVKLDAVLAGDSRSNRS